jgi:hypothetical protein
MRLLKRVLRSEGEQSTLVTTGSFKFEYIKSFEKSS